MKRVIKIDNKLHWFYPLDIGRCVTFYSQEAVAGGIKRKSKNHYIVYVIYDGFCTHISAKSLTQAIKTIEEYLNK